MTAARGGSAVELCLAENHRHHHCRAVAAPQPPPQPPATKHQRRSTPNTIVELCSAMRSGGETPCRSGSAVGATRGGG